MTAVEAVASTGIVASLETRIVAALRERSRLVYEVASEVGLDVDPVAALLRGLEVRGLVKRAPDEHGITRWSVSP